MSPDAGGNPRRGQRGAFQSPPWWLVGAAFAVVLPFLGKAPVIDEEGYLWVARHYSPLRPYDWTRIWPPFASDAYGWAHPPLHLLWLRLWSWLDDGPALRLVAGAPWIALLSASFARLSSHLCHHPGLAAGLWITSPIVVLGLQDTWMIDLPAVALLTAAVASYREGLVDEEPRWFIASGMSLGLAIETKYSMAVVAPVFAVHMLRLGPRPALWLAAGAVILAVELPLIFLYGSPHPWAVWLGRGQLASSALLDRGLGTLTRAALLGVPLVLVRTNVAYAGLGLAIAAVVVFLARPSEMPVTTAAFLVACAACGATLLVRAAAAALSSPVRRRKGDRGDPLLLGGWFLAVAIGVVFGHNYASARYLLPAAAPAALLLARSGEEALLGKAILRLSIGMGAVLSLVVAVADHRFAAAAIDVARESARVVATDLQGQPGRFAGEWGFRGAMESAGWSRYRPDETLAAGTYVIVADNASSGALDAPALEPIRRVESEDEFPVRVVDGAARVGLYAETLGVLPIGHGVGPLEAATIYRVRAPVDAP